MIDIKYELCPYYAQNKQSYDSAYDCIMIDYTHRV